VAASHTVSQWSAIPQISRLGILTLYGFGIRVTMQAGHLQVEDGVGPERRRLRLARVNHRLKRLVCIGDDGFVTLSALKWLSDVGASFVMLDRLGRVRVVTGPPSPSEARLRRAQALALSSGVALTLARELISMKLNGQELLVRERLQDSSTADSLASARTRLSQACDLNAIRGIESRAAAEYWNAWRDVPVLFPRKDVGRVPTHWLSFGTRHSPLTGGPRLAVNPANALLNYVNAVAESECRLAAVACGLDPGLGLLHTDTASRDSLALDLIETIRPAIEAWLLDWLLREPLRKSDFLEASDGNCRISSALCSRLSETAPTWRNPII
jgi:CRISPR-associated protein Cas1